MSQSNGCLKTTMKLLAGILALLVILSLPISLLIFDVSRVIFSPEILSEQLTSQLIESGVLRSFVTDQLSSPDFLEKMGPGDINFMQILENLSPGDRETLVDILLPPGWLGSQIGQVFRALNVWFDNEEPLPKLVLDIRPLKDRLMSGGVEEILEMIVDSWPSCSTEQTTQLREATLQSKDIPILYCEPPEPFRERLMGYGTEMMIEFVREIPPEFVLGEEEVDPQEAVDTMATKEWIRLVRILSRVIWLIPIALLGLIMALAIRSWSEFGRWWGIPLLLSGVIIFGYVLLMPIGRDFMLPRLLSDTRLEAESVYEMAEMVITGLVDVIRGLLVFHALLIGGIGLVLLVVGWLIGRRAATAKQGPPVERSTFPSRETPVEEGPSSGYIPPPPPVSPMPEDEIPIEGPEE
ncbi:MAG TPA: hypothetical protein G4O11_12840 [Anaerolineae bacterium]|nr:hypothetical protein [Anaerolineae bacterium]